MLGVLLELLEIPHGHRVVCSTCMFNAAIGCCCVVAAAACHILWSITSLQTDFLVQDSAAVVAGDRDETDTS